MCQKRIMHRNIEYMDHTIIHRPKRKARSSSCEDRGLESSSEIEEELSVVFHFPSLALTIFTSDERLLGFHGG